MKNSPKALFDVVIVGSGPAGVSAAHPLVKAGLNVCMIDGGLDSKKRDETVSSASISTTRSNALDILMKGSFAFGQTYKLLKVKSNIDIIQTLAKGGLSEFWHGVCDFLTPEELEETGLPPDEIQAEYKQISNQINLDRKPQLDLHGKLILKNASNRVYGLPIAYPYRTSKVVDSLKRHKNFTYIPGQLVFKVKDKKGYAETESFSIDNKLEKMRTSSHYVILAAGSLNTTRILLRSFNLFNYKTTFLTKSHSMIVCIHPRTLLSNSKLQIENPGQIAFVSNETKQKLGSFVQIYRCNPLMFDKALEHIPLPKLVASPILAMLIHHLVIADVRFPVHEAKEKFCRLKKENGGKDILEVSFRKTSKEIKNHKLELSKITQTLKTLGLIPLKIVSDPVTSHYGGGVPFQQKPGRLSSDLQGKPHGSKRIYIADSSTWRALPAKPLAITIMAHASLVAKNVLKKFTS